MMPPPQRPSDAPNASAKPGQKRESSIIRMAMSGDSLPGAEPPSALLPLSCPERIFANCARTMSGTPNAAPSSRIRG